MKRQTRMRFGALAICMAAVFLPGQAAAADGASLQARMAQATEWMQQGRFQDALRATDEALGLAEAQGQASSLVAVLTLRMGLLAALQDFAAAEASAQRAYEASERAGSSATSVGGMLSLNAALLALSWGRPSQAAVWSQRSLAIAEKVDRQGSLYAAALRVQSNVDEALGHYGAAMQGLARWAQLDEKTAARNPERQVSTLMRLADLRRKHGDEAGAQRAWAQALELQLARPDGQRGLPSLVTLLRLHQALGPAQAVAAALDRAYAALADAAEVSPMAASTSPADLAKRRQASEQVYAWRQIGKVERERGRLPEAETAVRRAMALSERMDGPGNANLPAMQVELADVLRDRAALPAAADAYADALARMEKAAGGLSSDMVGALDGLARVRWAQGDHAGAEDLLRREIALYDAHIAPDHPQLARALTLLAEWQTAHGRDAQAKAAAERAAAILAARH